MKKIFSFKTLQTAIMALAGCLILLGVLMTADQMIFAKRVYPNLVFASDDVSLMNLTELNNYLAAKAAELRKQDMVLRYGELIWEIPLGELGISFDENEWRAQILDYARSDDIWENLLLKAGVLTHREEIVPAFHLADEEAFELAIQPVKQEIEVAETNASLKIKDGQAKLTKSKIGKRLQDGVLKAAILAYIQSFGDGVIDLELSDVEPRVLEKDVKPLLEQANEWAAKTAVLRYDLHVWDIYTDELAGWIGTSFDEQSAQVKLTTNTDQARQALEERAQNGFNEPPQNAVFEFDNGKVTRFVPSRDGMVLDAEQTLMDLDEAFYAGGNEAEIAVKVQEPEVKNEDVNDMGIKERVGRGVSYFRGSSWARMHNIETAANKLNGQIVEPHSEFSYNAALGDISIDTGYVVGLIISQGMTQEGVGGGVCQPSTTMFRAALDAGFPITQRYAHAYRVHYYEEGGPGYEHAKPGIDATVYAPSKDLRFLNDTDHHVLIQTTYDQASYRLVIDLYSTDVGKEVSITEPVVYNLTSALPPVYIDVPDQPTDYLKQVDWAAGGADAQFSRIVTLDGEVIIDETFTSHYKPWSAKYERGTMGLEEETGEGGETQDGQGTD